MVAESAGKSVGKFWGAGGSAGDGAAMGGFLGKGFGAAPRQRSLQHPEFSQHSSQHLPQLFSGFPRFSIL